MYCSQCGNAMTPGSRFCPQCGTPAADRAAPFNANAAPTGERRFSWKLPCGIFSVLLLVGLFTAGIFATIYFILKNSDANQVAQAALRQDPAARQALGEIKSFGLPWGSISTSSGGTGNAAFSLSVEGSKNSGKFFATLKKENDLWTMTSGRLVLQNGQSILLSPYNPQRLPSP